MTLTYRHHSEHRADWFYKRTTLYRHTITLNLSDPGGGATSKPVES